MIHNPQSGGIHLPALTNPAGAAQILSGYQAINADGEIITGNIPSQGAQTITPGTANKTIAAGRYLSGTQTIAGDADLVPGNIKSGVSIFGVSGSYSGNEPVYGEWDESMVSSVGRTSFTITTPSNIGTLLGLSFGGTQQPSVIGYYILGMDAGFALTMRILTVVSIQISTSGKKINLTLNSSTGISVEALTNGGRYCYLPA